MTLSAILGDRAKRAALVRDAVQALEQEVALRLGLSGMALRAGFAAFERLAPGILPAAVDRLLPYFAPVVDRQWEQAVASGDPDAWFRREAGAVADALLGVTDAVAERASNRVLVRLYRSLRGQARPHVVAGVPRIPAILRTHLR